jgi:DNA-binding transcriptional MerR regulator
MPLRLRKLTIVTIMRLLRDRRIVAADERAAAVSTVGRGFGTQNGPRGAAAAGASASGAARDVLTIRELAKEFGVTARTLRYYEEKGLLTPHRKGHERLYSRRARARLAYVLMGKRVGFSLDEIREMLDLYDLDSDPATQLESALATFGERIGRLERQRAEIERMIEDLRRAHRTMCDLIRARAGGSKPRIRMKAGRARPTEGVSENSRRM